MYSIIRTLFEEQKMQSKAAVFLHLRPIYCALTIVVMIHVSKINERGLKRELFGQTTHEPG
jgi:hypothetical protein